MEVYLAVSMLIQGRKRRHALSVLLLVYHTSYIIESLRTIIKTSCDGILGIFPKKKILTPFKDSEILSVSVVIILHKRIFLLLSI